jgi:SOS-response transcriptional repressor LexA
MTKERAAAARAVPPENSNTSLLMTGLSPISGNTSTVQNDVTLNQVYLGDPGVTIIHRVDGSGFDDPPVSVGDLVVGDRRVKPIDRCLVIAVIGGMRVVRLFSTDGGHQFLHSGSEACETLEITSRRDVEILAAVVSIIPVIP